MAQPEAELKKAIKKGDRNLVRKLVADGVPVNAELPGKVTALEFALAEEQRDIVEDLLERGAVPRRQKRNNLLLDVPKFRDVKLLERLIDLGADVHAADDKGHTPFLMAVAAGYYEAVEYLVNRGVDLKARTADGRSALQLAAETRRFCEELLPGCSPGEEAEVLFRAQLQDLDRIERHLESLLPADQLQALRDQPPPAPEPSTFWDFNDLVELRIEIAPFPFTSRTASQITCRLGREGKKWLEHFSSEGRLLIRIKDHSDWLPLALEGLDNSRKPARGSPTWLKFHGDLPLPSGKVTIELRIDSHWDIFEGGHVPGWEIVVN